MIRAILNIMWGRSFLILVCCFLQLQLVGNNGLADSVLTKNEITWLSKNKHKIRYSLNSSLAPSDYINEEGIQQGIVSDYIKIFEKKLGVSFQNVYFENTTDIYDNLIDSKVDFIEDIYKADEKKDFLVFTDAFLNVPLVLLVRKDAPQNFSANHIDNMKLAYVNGYASLEYIINTFQDTNLVECKDDLAALLQTSFGNTDGTLSDLMSASYMIEKYGINNLIIRKELDFTWQLRFACRKEFPELCSILNKTLRTIDKSERLKIYNKWVHVNYISNPGFFEKNLKLLILSAIILLTSFVLILSYSLMLKTLINKRTRELKFELEEKKRAVNLSQKNETRLESLFEISNRKTETIEQLFDYALSEAVKLTDSKLGLLYLYNHNDRLFSISNYLDITDETRQKPVFKEKISLDEVGDCGDVIRKETAFISNACSNCNHNNTDKCIFSPVKTDYSMIIPIKEDDEVMAVLFMANKETDYDNADAKQLILLMNSVWKLFNKQKWQEQLLIAKEKAEENDRLKSAFLANISHEIRTPMNGILGFTDLLRNSELTDDAKENYISIIGKSGQRMLSTINDIIEISKIESGQVSITESETNLNEQLLELYQFFKPEVERKGIRFSVQPELPVKDSTILTDNEKLFAVLTNLINNAIKFTKKGEIEFGYQLKGNEIKFFVNDTGIGISKEKQESVFDRFVQEEQGCTRQYEGSGLGLSIAGSYIKMLGGEIWMDSSIGKGTKIYFTIPYKSVNKSSDLPEQRNESLNNDLPGKLNILIAEDDDISYKYLSLVIENVGSKIYRATTGTKAIELCRNNPDIDLILMDIKMPQMNGYEATQKIREFNKDVIIIAQTAYVFADDQKKALHAGCNDYISKPIDKTLLLTKISKLLA